MTDLNILNADLVTAQDLIDYINNEFDDPEVVYIGSSEFDGLAITHRVTELTDGSLTHDLIIDCKPE